MSDQTLRFDIHCNNSSGCHVIFDPLWGSHPLASGDFLKLEAIAPPSSVISVTHAADYLNFWFSENAEIRVWKSDGARIDFGEPEMEELPVPDWGELPVTESQ